MITKRVTVQDVLNQQVATGNYSIWTEDELVNEVMNRRLVHGVSIASFPDEKMRMSRLVEMLEGNDRLRDDLKRKGVCQVSNIYYPERLTSFYEVLKSKLSSNELFDFLCFLDDGMANELLEMLSADCNVWFPDQFADYHKEIES